MQFIDKEIAELILIFYGLTEEKIRVVEVK